MNLYSKYARSCPHCLTLSFGKEQDRLGTPRRAETSRLPYLTPSILITSLSALVKVITQSHHVPMPLDTLSDECCLFLGQLSMHPSPRIPTSCL